MMRLKWVVWAVLLWLPVVSQGAGMMQDAATDLPVMSVDTLPAQARVTLLAIKRGGPFPYPRDGEVFNNFERVLPVHRHGYYHEYTVPTPGKHNRGVRRIVSGTADEYYYTADHYQTFKRIRE